ncbi:16S rRNA (uracil(1498)-N(3))-methyltransferase [Gordonia amarae]|uniref:Ribosomal RNA small subunit methyltransferase E n=2 Tax=Gordonia amarae TaxID=36821 RepID=G7GJS3_9ACTN|nr:16S rRNA (uracil(1498)-N(3))-methyltransferase [Gordonia amarae]MCS3879756.1 16S rRNA (uracil1498-N3)-methyltransferase [Gordonia amarae]QHN18189.1 16S rRNA (uracil(1498)-N(3))-methyltransferase [Gordonia amarae]QHN22673.1 16S rRNA (uracil(1498)-N(3))-methyltransferase [Gordonia amarae]QHN31576.1 16S rRNA (uracil(1498)-N(3))-methyltransferase [Gordonia amarae]QHN40320.1 16S rRNA (uracil(1498)-N(3))-methyltransferase [Gordonia amarae]
MGAPLFWVDSVPSAGAEVLLSGPEGRHAVTVARVRVGETIRVGDGRGSVGDCEVVDVAGKDKLRAVVRTFTYADRPRPTVTVVQALPKAERSELAVDLATQAGADRIVPWQAARCVSRWTGKSDKGIRKWEQAAEAAAKQARRAWVPEITDLAGTTDVRSRCAAVMAAGGVVAVLHEEATTGFASLPLASAKEIVLVVGPEGGIDETELADLTALGAIAVLLGPEVLRTATAAAVALGAIGVMTPRWPR